MHPAVLDYVAQWATDRRLEVLDIGGRDVNGSCRQLFPYARWTAVDLLDGRGVDIVGDILELHLPQGGYDLVLCTEVLEHCAHWRAIVHRAGRLVRPGGRVIITCAGEGRSPHSGVDGGPTLQSWEYYRNVKTWDLYDELVGAGLDKIHLVYESTDLRASALRPLGRG